MKVEIESLNSVKRKLRIEVPSQEVTKAFDRAYLKLGKQARVKGFRPGKAPRSILERHFHQQVEDEVSEELVRRSVGEALKEQELDPVSLNLPETLVPIAPGEDYRFSVELEVLPEFTVEDYEGLALKAPEVEIAEEMVEARLKEIREHNATLKPLAAPRGIEEGDFVILDYQVYYAGKAVSEAKGENQYLEVGQARFNADFERQLLGLMEGGESRFSVDLPPDFFNPLLAGKTVEFQVKIKEIKEKSTPDLNDAFAQGLGGNFQTLADLREGVREDIIKGKERERQGRLEEQVLEQLMARHAFEIPPSLVSREQESILKEQFERFQQQGMNVAGLDQEKLMESVRPVAERRVKARLILERLAAQEGLGVEEAEVEAALARVAVSTGRDMAQVREFYKERDLMEAVERRLRDEKTMKLVLDKAIIDTAPEAEAAQESS